MTTDEERIRTLHRTREFLVSLMFPQQTPKVPRIVRERAYRLLKHYPMSVEIDNIDLLQQRNALLVTEIDQLKSRLDEYLERLR